MAAYNLIATTMVGSGGASTIVFSSIPQTYTDLLVVVSGRTTGTGSGLNITFNGNTSNYSNRTLQGNGAAASSYGTYNRNAGFLNMSTETASVFGSSAIYIPNYAGSTNKSYLADGVAENNATTAYSGLIAGLWSDTAAITSVLVSPMDGSFVQYSSASLYGIKNS
jgi:hypothetical protein